MLVKCQTTVLSPGLSCILLYAGGITLKFCGREKPQIIDSVIMSKNLVFPHSNKMSRTSFKIGKWDV